MGVGWVFLHDNVEMALPDAEGLEVVGHLPVMRHSHQLDRVGWVSAVSHLQMEMGVGYGHGKSILLELRSVHAIYSDKPILDHSNQENG